MFTFCPSSKIDTHDETGTRIRYSKDDDKLQLRDLVMQERLGTRKSMDVQMAGRIMGDKKFEVRICKTRFRVSWPGCGIKLRIN